MRCLAVGMIRRADGALLLQTGYDPNKNEHFYRPLGGGIEFGEHSRVAFAREIREELGAEVADARLIGWIENIFEVEGRPSHEIMAVYEATLADPSFIYARGERAGRSESPVRCGLGTGQIRDTHLSDGSTRSDRLNRVVPV